MTPKPTRKDSKAFQAVSPVVIQLGVDEKFGSQQSPTATLSRKSPNLESETTGKASPAPDGHIQPIYQRTDSYTKFLSMGFRRRMTGPGP